MTPWFDDSGYKPKSFTWGRRFLGAALRRPDGVYRYHLWALKGVYYGYPLCCIKEMLDGVIQAYNDRIDHVPRHFEGTGYIPCEACAQKTPEELIHAIQSQRVFSLPFPCAQQDADFPVLPKLGGKNLIWLLKRRVQQQDRFSIDDFRVKVGELLPSPGDPHEPAV